MFEITLRVENVRRSVVCKIKIKIKEVSLTKGFKTRAFFEALLLDTSHIGFGTM